MDRIPVNSSSLVSIGHDPDSQTLEVEFNHGAIYQYQGVSQETFDQFMSAPSKGNFFNQNIAKVYIFVRVS